MGDIRVTAGEDLPLTMKESARLRRKVTCIAFLVLVLVVVAGFLVKVRRYALATGYVTTIDYAEVRSPVTGIVSKIFVSSGDVVEEGQVLVQLNSEEEEALLAETRARVSKLETEMERRQAEMSIDLERRKVELAEQKREHQDQISVAQLQYENASVKLKLSAELVEKGLKAANSLEDDRLREELAKVTLASLKNKDFKIYEELLVRDGEKYKREMDALKNELSALQDSVRRVEARLQTKKVRAPIAGQVVRYEFVIGELLQPSSVIYEIFGGDKQVLKLRVNEKFATKIGAGQKYRAKLSMFSGVPGLSRRYFYGDVQALRNVIQGEGDRTYRVAYCDFNSEGLTVPPGATAEARIYYGVSNFWLYLFNVDM